MWSGIWMWSISMPMMPTQNKGFQSTCRVYLAKRGADKNILHSLMVFSTNIMAWIWRIGLFCADIHTDNNDNRRTQPITQKFKVQSSSKIPQKEIGKYIQNRMEFVFTKSILCYGDVDRCTKPVLATGSSSHTLHHNP